MSGVGGAVGGAVLGIFFFPLSAQEQVQFSQIRSIVGALVAGIVGTRLVDILQFLTKTEGSAPPKLLQRNYAISVGLFIISLGIALVLQYATRAWVESRVKITAFPNQKGFVAEKGTYAITADGDFRMSAGNKVRFSGAATLPNNVGVHWRLEPADSSSAIDNKLVSIDESGSVTTEAASKWGKALPARIKVVASSDGDPTAASVVGLTIETGTEQPSQPTLVEKPPVTTTEIGAST